MVNSNQTPCPDGFLYTIVIGDTLYSIANRYNISVQSILNANTGLQADRLQIGQQICIPATPPVQEECPGRLYTIQPGDTLIEIARRFGYTLDALISINPGVNPNNLRVGEEICLPPSPGGGPFPCYGGSIYRIKPGDTLFSIARQYGVTLEQIITANPQLDANNLIIGDPVCIPR